MLLIGSVKPCEEANATQATSVSVGKALGVVTLGLLALLVLLHGQDPRPVHVEPSQKEAVAGSEWPCAEELPDRLRREMLDMIDKAWAVGGLRWLGGDVEGCSQEGPGGEAGASQGAQGEQGEQGEEDACARE